MNRAEALIRESQRRTTQATARGWECPATFVGFLEWVDVVPFPVQRVFCLVAYDGLEPCELEGEEREIARALFQGVDRFEPFQRRKVWSLMGGRAGKTYMFGALRLVWGAFIRDLSSLAPGQKAVALCCAPNDALRQEIINYQLGVVRSKPELRACLVSPRTAFDDDAHPESFVIRRPQDGQLVTFAGASANRGGYSGRGRSLTDFLADEMAFFLGEKNVVNDKEIVKGAAPRVLPGGQVIAQTTAFAKIGYHWEQFAENYGHPRSAMAAKAKTEDLRPDPTALSMVEAERITDPENARREFDAEPMAEGASIFFSGELIARCIQPIDWYGTTAHAKTPGIEKSAGGDMGFRSNSSALAIAYVVMSVVVLGFMREGRPKEDGSPLRPGATVRSFATDIRMHGISFLWADGHYREAVAEHLEDIALEDMPANHEAYVRLRTLMRDGRLAIPDPDLLPPELAGPIRRLIRQLKEVRGEPTAGGRMTIYLPKWPDGSHGDLVAALANAAWPLSGESLKEPPPKQGTEAWALQEMAALQSEIREERSTRRRR